MRSAGLKNPGTASPMYGWSSRATVLSVTVRPFCRWRVHVSVWPGMICPSSTHGRFVTAGAGGRRRWDGAQSASASRGAEETMNGRGADIPFGPSARNSRAPGFASGATATVTSMLWLSDGEDCRRLGRM